MGEVFWGSFGEGAGRTECAVFRGASVSELIGFDAESKTAIYSTDLDWSSDEEFIFNGVAIRESDVVSTLGQGAASHILGRTLAGSVRTGDSEESDLSFETFAKSEATYHIFELVGQTRASIRVAQGVDGKCFTLYTDSRGKAYGAAVKLDEFGLMEFVTPDGDVFQIDLDSESGSLEGFYSLVDGRSGLLSDATFVAGGSVELNAPMIERLWLTDANLRGQEGSSTHFVLKGDGLTQIKISAMVSVLDADPDWFTQPMIELDVFKLGIGEIYSEWASSDVFAKVIFREHDLTGALLEYSGQLDLALDAGTYLVRINGVGAAQAVNDLEIEFGEGQGPKVVNASALYLAGQVAEGRFFGFSLKGTGLAKTVVRNVGPSLSQFDLPSHTSDPRMAIYRDSVKTWKNDDWGQASAPSQLSAEMSYLGAFELTENSKDAVAKLTLESGEYEVVPQGQQKDSAYELIEVYFD